MKGIASHGRRRGARTLRPTLPNSTYEMIRAAAAAHAKAPALSFFLRVQDHERPTTWSYETLFARITATANFFHSLGIGKDDVVAFVLPNLPETHLTIWGGEAAGIVFAINPLLEPAAIAELLRAGEARCWSRSRPSPGSDLWSKLQPMLAEVPGLRHVVLVDLARICQARPEARGARRTARGDADRIAVHDFAAGIAASPRTAW